MQRIRIALCQLECHPAIYSSHINFLEEPFVPVNRNISLSGLALKGIDTGDLQFYCYTSYIKWIEARTASILRTLDEFDPAPDLVLWPEGSLPLSTLDTISEWSATSGSTILAGTHTPLKTTEAVNHYNNIGISRKRLDQVSKKDSRNVLPIISQGKTKLVEKQQKSPFEQSVVSQHSSNPPRPHAYPLPSTQNKVSMLPIICSEALVNPRLPRDFDIIGIISYDKKPTQFEHFIQTQIHNRKIVAYCNDGHFGGSMVYTVDDKRNENWLWDAFPNGLPPGDIILARISHHVKRFEGFYRYCVQLFTFTMSPCPLSRQQGRMTLPICRGSAPRRDDAVIRAQDSPQPVPLAGCLVPCRLRYVRMGMARSRVNTS